MTDAPGSAELDDSTALEAPSSPALFGLPQLGAIGVFSAGLDFGPIEAAQEAVLELEELGYGTIWYPDSGERESLVKASMLLGATRTIIVATGIASIWTRHPRVVHGASRALEDAYPGRFLLGLGASHQHIVEDVLHQSYDRPRSAMRDYLAGIDEVALVSSSHSRSARVLAALGPRMLELARDSAEGAHPYLVTPEHTALAREILGPDKILAVEQAVSLSFDRDVSRSRGRAHLNNYMRAPNYLNNWKRLGFSEMDFVRGGSDRLVDSLIAGGSVETILERLREHFEAGASHVCIQALGDNPRELPLEQWRGLAPALRDLAQSVAR